METLKIYELLKAELPKNAAKIIHKTLSDKNKKYSISYIKNQLYINNTSFNIDIIEAAIDLCEQEINRRIELTEKAKQLKNRSVEC